MCALLGQELERRLNTTRTLEAVYDALILWSLEGTDPALDKLLTEEEITQKMESVIPSAKKFLRGQIKDRLASLATKIDGARRVNIYKKAGRYCLPFDTRQILKEHTIEDEKLKVEVTASFMARLAAYSSGTIDTATLDKIASVLHSTLESVFQRQGLDAARHFLDQESEDQEPIDNRAIIEIGETILKDSDIRKAIQPTILPLMKLILRDLFYASNIVERAYCARLARTYILLFTIRNTPEIIEYFNSMAQHFLLYIGSDLVIRSLSEYYVYPEDWMTLNAFRIIQQSGSKLILSEVTLQEVHSHIYAAHLEYQNTYLEIDHIVDRDLASQCDRILIRAYYYAKLDDSLRQRPQTWSSYLNNFLSSEKMSGSTSDASMRSLKQTLCNMFGFEFEPTDDTVAGIDRDELSVLARKIQELRHGQKARDEILAEGDAIHILRVQKISQG